MAVVLAEAIAAIAPIEMASHVTIGKILPKAMISTQSVLACDWMPTLDSNLIL